MAQDTFITFENGVKTLQEEDRKGDGKIDARYHFDAKGVLLVELLDEDHDGELEVRNEYEGEKIARRTCKREKTNAKNNTNEQNRFADIDHLLLLL